MNTVSVVLPCYNCELTIDSTIQSIINQSYKKIIEIIIVDDGSTDNTPIKLNQLKAQDSRIKIHSKKNGGVSSARNLGMLKANGNYIALCDSDDVWHPKKIEKQLSIIDLKKIKFLGCPIKRSNWYGLKEITIRLQLLRNHFQPSTIIFEKSIIDEVGLFDEEMTHAEEGNFYFKILIAGIKCFLHSEVLIEYGNGKKVGDSGLSADLKKMHMGQLKNIRFVKNNWRLTKAEYYFVILIANLKYYRRIFLKMLNEIK